MTTPRDAANNAVWSAFAADSLSLAAHWVYDVKSIKKQLGTVDTIMAPGPGSHHKGKQAGNFTHYGDQALVLLESLEACQGFNLDDFFRRWKLLFADYGGYVDGATRNTLKNIAQGAGPSESGAASNDLAGASRMAPLLACYPEDLDALVTAARAQTKMTHNTPTVIDAAEFFARAAFAVIHGTGPTEALRKAAEARYLSLPARDWVDTGLRFADSDTVSATLNFGQSCNVDGAFKSVAQTIARHAQTPRTGVIETVMAGGDSAARGLIVGLVLGASADPETLPGRWADALTAKDAIARGLSAV